MEKKCNYYSNIDITRVILTIILVLYHAFAPYGKGWSNPINVDNTTYWWLAKFLYNGFLEGFVLISGFCYALSCSKRPFRIIPKLKRLMLPSILWSTCWLLLFSNVSIDSPLFWYKAISGAGHLWFLPMLFCCFILQNYFIKKSSLKTFLGLILLSILPYPDMPLHLNDSFHYLVYFNAGILLYNKYDIFILRIERISIFKNISILILYYSYLIVSLYVKYNILEEITTSSLVLNALKVSTEHLLRMSQVFPMALLYFSFGIVCSKYIGKWGGIINSMAMLSFPIYILQEFILRFLYYRTCWCFKLGAQLYPWCGFLLTILIAYLLSLLLKQNKLTKLIIG